MPVRRLVLVLVLVLVLLTGLGRFGVPAAAHTQIQRATPGPGGTVSGDVDEVVLDFLDPVLPTPEITVSGPDGRPVAGLGPAELVADDVVRIGFDPLTVTGEYQVDYTFVALDGDEQVSAHTFAYEAGGDGDLDVRSLLAWVVGAVLVALVVAAVLGRRRSRV